MERTTSPALPHTIANSSASAALNFVPSAFRTALADLSAMKRAAAPTSLGSFVIASSFSLSLAPGPLSPSWAGHLALDPDDPVGESTPPTFPRHRMPVAALVLRPDREFEE